MKTKRSITINNSLVHGICNYNCITCSINKSSFKGPKEYQTENLTKKIIGRVSEAASEGIYIRRLDNSGDGEPTLHPEFSKKMDMFGDLLRNWDNKKIPPPEISVVTNGSNLDKPGIFETLERNKISLIISFPTSNPEHYGEIMMMDASKGAGLLKKIIPSIEKAMKLRSEKKLSCLEFHISPPFMKYVRPDFPQTLSCLIRIAEQTGLEELRLEMFPAPSNRAGAVKTFYNGVDLYKDYFKMFNQKKINNVRVKMALSNKYFYPQTKDFFDLLWSFRFPCLWYGNIFLSPFGDSICCNDQNVLEKNGSVLFNTIKQIIEMKETKMPSELCRQCGFTPLKFIKYRFFTFYNILAEIKTRVNVWLYGKNRPL